MTYDIFPTYYTPSLPTPLKYQQVWSSNSSFFSNYKKKFFVIDIQYITIQHTMAHSSSISSLEMKENSCCPYFTSTPNNTSCFSKELSEEKVFWASSADTFEDSILEMRSMTAELYRYYEWMLFYHYYWN